MTTEMEAKTQWCPIRAISIKSETHTSVPATAHCIGSRCMLWRWHTEVKSTPGRGTIENPTGYVQKIEKSEHGYCGLAPKEEVISL